MGRSLTFGLESSKEFDGGTRLKNRETMRGSRGEWTFPGGFLVPLSAMNSEPVQKPARMEDVATCCFIPSPLRL
jgi:hypothetical protein